MIRKAIETAVLLPIAVVLPVLGHPDILQSWPFWVVTLYGIALNMSQPKMENSNKSQSNMHDRSSMLLILIGAMLCFIIPLADYAHGSDRTILISQASTLAGLAMIWGGFLFRYWSISILGKFFTSKVEIQQDHQLIQNGPYRYLRHPSYTGAWISQIGISLFLQSKVGLAFSIIAYFFIYVYRIECEEKALEGLFGDLYAKYRQRSWRLIPFLY